MTGNAGHGQRSSGHWTVSDRSWALNQGHPVFEVERAASQTVRFGACSVSAGAFRTVRAGGVGKVQVRTGLGKSRCPGSQGGLPKRGHGSRTEAQVESPGFATGPYRPTRGISIPTTFRGPHLRGELGRGDASQE